MPSGPPVPGAEPAAGLGARTPRLRCPHCGQHTPVPEGADRATCRFCKRIFEVAGSPGQATVARAAPAAEQPTQLPGPAADAPTVASAERQTVAQDEQETVVSGPPETVADDTTGLHWLRERLGEKYDEIEFVARGGMGVVYRAHQKQPSRSVALKVMLSGAFASERHKKRFEREAEAVAALQHPAIVPIYEVGEVGGQPYFTMEFVEGRDLATYVRKNRLGYREICELMIQICEAVDHAHTHGIIHRDLKPGNVMVESSGRCRILDFGLARMAQRQGQAMSLLTVSGDVMGTPRYMSPEQALGKPREIDGRTDVYSLGVIFYELVVGVPPYNLEGVQGYQALQIIRSAEPLRPTLLHASMAADLEAILLKALEKEKPNRYRTARALAEDLKSFLADKPVSAQAATTTYRLKKFAWRNRRVILPALAGIFLLGLLGGIAGTVLWRSMKEKDTQIGHLLNKAGGVDGIKPYVLELTRQDKWSDAMAITALAQKEWPDEPAVKGLTARIKRLAKEKADRLASQMDGLIRKQDYEAAERQADGLFELSPLLPWQGLREQVRRKASSFEDDCWKDLERTFPEDGWADVQKTFSEKWGSYEGALVYTRQASEGFVENYLGRFGDRPHGKAANQILERLKNETGDYFLQRRLASALQEKRHRNWEGAVAVLEGAAEAVEQADVGYADGWKQRFAELQREIDSVIWKATAAKVTALHVLTEHTGLVKCVAFRPGAERCELVSGSSDNTLKRWDGAAGQMLQSFDLASPVRAAAFSPEGTELAAGCEDGTVHLWRNEAEKPLSWLSGHIRRLQVVAFSPDGRLLLTVSAEAVKLWNVEAGEPTEFRVLEGAEDPAAFSPLARLVAAKAEDRIRLWDLDSDEELKGLECPSLPLALAFSPDGKLLAAGCRDDSVRIWDLKTLELKHPLMEHRRPLCALAFSPDGQVLASAGMDHKIILWDMTGGKRKPRPLKVLEGHEKWVLSLAFSHDGRLLASASNDKTVRIWGIQQEKQPH